jgi:hypothetical protein
MNTDNLTLVGTIALISGVGLKVIWDAVIDKKKQIELQVWSLKADQLERRLSQFFWPIYLRLQRDNVVWEKILERDNQNGHEHRNLAYQIEQDVLLPNHLEIVKIIELNIHLAGVDKEFEQHLMAYMRHVDVYKSSRAAGIKDKDPVYFGEPYPQGFFEALSKKLQTYQIEYEKLLKDGAISSSN